MSRHIQWLTNSGGLLFGSRVWPVGTGSGLFARFPLIISFLFSPNISLSSEN